MMEAPAEVVRVGDGRVWVRLRERQGGCGRCDEPGGCRSMRITDAFGKQTDVFALRSDLALHPGDRVRLSMPDGGPLHAALMSYGLAAVLVLVGAAGGSALVEAGSSDAGAFAGMVAGLVLAVGVNRLLARSRRWRYRLGVSIHPDGAECTHFRTP